MSDLVVIVPSRGRPRAADEMVSAFRSTCTADTQLMFAVDDDDPDLERYRAEVLRAYGSVASCPSRTMVEALNYAANAAALGQRPYAIAFMGDDHRPRTAGWDAAYLEALRELGTGIVYGNDLLQQANLPTQCAMTADIVRALGWMAPPPLRHLYVDNFWRDLGRRAGCIRYLDNVVVEHMHPVAGKAPWDAGHQRVNSREMYNADQVAYGQFVASGGLDAAVATVEGLRG